MGLSKSRLEAFSDGVLAIVITIMVLEMKVPHGTDLASLRPLIPVFLSYLLSFIHLGIYWNNHHHLFQAVQKVNGRVLWANLHLLFWLSLIPFVTGWMGENNFAAWPAFFYGVVLLGASVAYYILERQLVATHDRSSSLDRAVGRDRKAKLSTLLYIVAVGIALWVPWASCGIYVLVAVSWLIPDRRIERELAAGLGLILLLAVAPPALAQGGPPVQLGSLSGRISYPSDEVPALDVYAFVQGNWTQFRKIRTKKGQSSFTFSSLVPGTYLVVAYPLEEGSLQGGYSRAVPCGLHAGCKDHSLIPVEVRPGQMSTGVEVKDWYAPEGAFPAKPK